MLREHFGLCFPRMTSNGLATLRFESMDLTGTDGSPVLINDYGFANQIRDCINEARTIVAEAMKSDEAIAFARLPKGIPTLEEECPAYYAPSITGTLQCLR